MQPFTYILTYCTYSSVHSHYPPLRLVFNLHYPWNCKFSWHLVEKCTTLEPLYFHVWMYADPRVEVSNYSQQTTHS